MNRRWSECLQEAHKVVDLAPGHSSQDRLIDAANRALLRSVGVRRPGQAVRVTQGRHKGLVGPIETISWCAAEIRIKGCARWFGCWQTTPYFEVVE